MRLLPRFRDRWLLQRVPPAPSVRLDQRRIFIMPTRTGLAFLGALLLMMLAAINYQNSLAYAMTFLLGSLFLVSILHTWRNLAGLVLHAGGASAAFVGEQARLKVRLESRGRSYQAVAVGWPASGMRLLDVLAAGSLEVELDLPATTRGWLRPGRLRVESRFPLGLLVAWSWVDLQLAALVYPRPLVAELPSMPGLDTGEGVQARGAGADDYQGLRHWQPGDSRRRLNWKAFSRGQGLLVKDFAALAGSDPELDFAALAGDVETRLSTLCHWVVQLSAYGQPFSLSLPGERLGPASGSEHQQRCLRALALYASKPESAV
ncbi:hypothetical protein QX25_04905 [Stutzerimonas stutzeri]|uniref:DUF58 domain-containing protein n=2 Tax=Stutzerimonas balearica DSM 6083 TaxID=1123016 RepID=A0A8D4C6Q8_9GAMM|nr:DUF58 domain-containing protein [Stutzerimonas balearica]AJE15077.1 hypothetical protein CL52_08445 [Stutzerimonas balearica DSM 6083]KIL05369.1 hypothetical protein QX25_04905 [Stutzerimonas stutzeri]